MKLPRPYLCFLAMAPLSMFAVSCSEPVAAVAPPTPKVNVAHPEVRSLVESDDYNGKTAAAETVGVRARVRGHIQKVGFTDGEIVKKGQVLFELDPRPFEADVGRAKDQLAVEQAQLVAAQKEEARLKDLLSKGGSSQSQVDKTEADRISLEAEVEAAKKEITRQELNLEYSKITAEISGRIGKAEMTVGNLVNAGGSDPLLATIVSVDPVYVYFSVGEREFQNYQKMRPAAATGPRSGDVRAMKLPFQFRLENDVGYPRSGMLDFVDNQVSSQTGTLQVRGVVANPDGILTPGSQVKIRLPLGEAKDTTLVPDTAVLSDQDKRYVLIVDDKNVVQRRDISAGRLLDDGMRVVLPTEKGPAIAPNEWLVVQGTQMARINYPVEPIKEGAAPSSSQPAAVPATKANP